MHVSAFLAQVLEFLRARWRAIAAAALIVLFAAGLAAYLPRLSNTHGSIFVGSPEIYTRERLVNDRYDQDYWLHRQLALLDVSDDLLTGSSRSSINAGLNAGTAAPADAPAPAAQAAVPESMPFDQQFLIRAGVRDAIRQLILENLLDDRHDLTGNSVYGLKFDLTVIAGAQTYDSAFAKVSVTAKSLFSEEEAAAAQEKVTEPPAATAVTSQTSLPEHVRLFFRYTTFEIEEDVDNPLHNAYYLYNQWLADVQSRLNTYHTQTGEVVGSIPCDSPDAESEWNKRIAQTVDDVLGINNAKVATEALAGTREVKLIAPWTNHLRILVDSFSRDRCTSSAVFTVDPIWDTVYVLPSTYAGGEYQLLEEVGDGRSAYFSMRGITDFGDGSIFQDLQPKYKKIGALVRYAQAERRLPKYTMNLGGQDIPVESLLIPSGFFNFVESVFRTDSYAYALFPKTEVSGFRTQRGLGASAGVALDVGGVGAAGGRISVQDEEAAFRVVPQVAGFSDTTTEGAKRGAVEFGWVVGGRGPLPSTEKAVLALVSVPAWTNELSVNVKSGWVNSRAEFVTTKEQTFQVPIPPDYEAFDAFVGGTRARHEPRISNDMMGQSPPVVACERASIIIPGFRLWRSTVVTLGDQSANRIVVLPNMRGIIATFTRYRPSAIPTTVSTAKLRVWTSEGVDTAKQPVTILPPADPKQCALPVSGDDGAPESGAAGGVASAGAADRLRRN